jgi:hypothetical protein
VLLFEEILEGLPGVVVAGRGRRSCGGRLLSVRSGSRVFLHGGAKFVEGAIIFRVLGGDSFGDGLGTLELGAGIEESALLAAVQLELAFGTSSVGIEAGGEDCAAVCASSPSYRADHSRGARAELIGARASLRWLSIVTVTAAARFVLFFLLFGIAVTAVTVLSIHKRLRPSVLTHCNQTILPLLVRRGPQA